MKPYLNALKQIVFSVVAERLTRYAVDQYVMPLVEKLPTKKRKPFGFNAR